MTSRLIYVSAGLAIAVALSGCQRKDPAADAAPATTTEIAVDTAPGAAATAVASTTAPAAEGVSTDAFVTNAWIGDMYEIQAGQIARDKAQGQAVKDFARMMVADHTALSNEMKPLVTAAGRTPPSALDERRDSLIQSLKAAAPADFDRVYLAQQEEAHREALTLMQGYAAQGDNAGLKAAAAKAAPKVQQHLETVKSLRSGGAR